MLQAPILSFLVHFSSHKQSFKQASETIYKSTGRFLKKSMIE